MITQETYGAPAVPPAGLGTRVAHVELRTAATIATSIEVLRMRMRHSCAERRHFSVYFDKWNGTLVTTVFGRNSRAPLISSEVWLCSRCCHHRAGTNSGRI